MSAKGVMVTASDQLSKWRPAIREPLVQFMAIGLLLFLLSAWRGDIGQSSNRIVITQGQLEALSAGFAGVWQRPPSEQELKSLVDDFVREEIATREAMGMGLDRDDVIIRRRLRQKLEFLTEDNANTSPPNRAELQAWLDQHPDKFRMEDQVAFRQVFLDPGRRHATITHDTEMLIARLSTTGVHSDIKAVGDPLMLPSEVPLSSRSDIAHQFGSGFADSVLKIPLGRWAGPIESAYGLHLVFTTEHLEGHLPSLNQILPVVEREVLAERHARELNAMYDRLLERYRVTAETRGSRAAALIASGPKAKIISTPKDIE